MTKREADRKLEDAVALLHQATQGSTTAHADVIDAIRLIEDARWGFTKE